MSTSEKSLSLLESYETYGDHFMDLDLWGTFLQQVCQRHSLQPCEPVRAGLAGTYPTFIIADRWVIKFFGQLFNGPAVYQAEWQVNQLIALHNQIPAPNLVASGDLIQTNQSWRWPYLIFEYVPGFSIGEVYEHVSFADKLALARHLGLITRKMHDIPLTGTAFDLPNGWARYERFLATQREICVRNHQKWGSLPERLVAQIDDYLLPIEALIDFDRAPYLIHADITRDHILGQISDHGWQMHALIDFGDVMIGNLFYELGALHLDTFQADHRLLKAYLQAYGLSDHQRQDFAHKAMSVVLMHQFNVFSGADSLLENEADSLEALATRLWGNGF